MRLRRQGRLEQDQRGGVAIEFAFAIPILLIVFIGILQLGLVFYAYAGLQHAVDESARYATIYPGPTDAQIRAKALEKGFGLKAAHLVGPTVTRGTSDGVAYVEISMAYNAPLDFVLINVPPVTLNHSRRAFQP